ncbi:MAG: Mth938-like domain-containing protein [Candidatus Polarisedimenticolaceae bacterium]|nr:Mth938-like domain-containing protein [Candidatus Polarisedimenticolaceae bacterium]
MNFNVVNQYRGQSIQAYDDGQVTVMGKIFTDNIIVLAKQTIEGWTEQSANALDQAAIDTLLALDVEILILGTGKQQIFPTPSLFAALANKGIGIEVMTTAAACRTYNILLAEERPVAAALLV